MSWLKNLFSRRSRRSTPQQITALRVANDTLRRKLAASYDAAQSNNANTRYWAAADDLSADAANSEAVRGVLRRRARYEASSNGSLDGIASTLANDLVGTEVRLQLTGMPDDIGRQVEAKFRQWSRAVRLADKLRLMRRTKLVDGEAFALMAFNPGIQSPVELDVVPIEADRVHDPWSTSTDPQNIDGIKLDDYGNPVAYYVLKDHPGSHAWTATPTEFDTYDA